MVTKKQSSAKKHRRPRVSFNHAMIYVRDVARALDFYERLLGFETIETVHGGPRLVYARLSSPVGTATIALHQVEAGQDLPRFDAMRLYFEVRELDAFCKRLASEGVEITQMPKPMPWGWTHAYLNDPDGHEVSLYWAGAKRLRKTDLDKMRRAAAK
ncbi:MAG TPA: VOC family protein [Bryobacteraceae bacterium]|nr:VOC family protein [Bryobacteraceae bacterium]